MMTDRYYVETRDPPPNSDLLHVSEHADRASAIETARTVHGRVWVEIETSMGPLRRLIDLNNKPSP